MSFRGVAELGPAKPLSLTRAVTSRHAVVEDQQLGGHRDLSRSEGAVDGWAERPLGQGPLGRLLELSTPREKRVRAPTVPAEVEGDKDFVPDGAVADPSRVLIDDRGTQAFQ